MDRIPDNLQLIDVFGPPTYNNFGEPRPFTNEAGTLIGFTTTFLVGDGEVAWSLGLSLTRLQVLSWIFVCLRLYVRMFVVRLPGWDDVFVSLYLVGSIVVHSQRTRALTTSGFYLGRLHHLPLQ